MLLAAAYVLPVTSKPIEDGAVLVREGVIEDVGTLADLRDRHPEEPVRDFGVAALMPGFVDLHTHLEFSAFRGLVDDLPYSRWKIALSKHEQAFRGSDWDDAAMLGALEAIQSGITTVADITDTGASIRAAAEAGLRGVVYREVSAMRKSRISEVMSEAAADLDEWRTEYANGTLSVGIAPHATYSCHPELLQAISSMAVDEGLPVSTHLAGSKDEYDFVKYGSSRLAVDLSGDVSWPEAPWLPTGVSPVRYVQQWGLLDVPSLLAVHCVQVDDDDIALLAEHDVAVANCPRCAAKLGMGKAPLKQFFAAGIRVGIGTDSPASNNTIDFFDEMRIGLLLQRSDTRDPHFYRAERYIRMATIEGAKALGIDSAVGSLEAGKLADLIAVDLSHSHQQPIRNPYSSLVHTANQENVLYTMVGGKVLFDAGGYETLDDERILARAVELRTRLRG